MATEHAMHDVAPVASSLVRLGHPWGDPELASLYDVFPFEDDLPLYLELASRQGGGVLELGCGTGRVLVPLARSGQQVVGVDVSPHMLRLAQDKLDEEGLTGQASLLQADVRSFAVARQFGFAFFAVKTFAHLLDRAGQLAALARVHAHLRPGGLLALDLLHPAPDWLLEPPGSLRQDLVQDVPERGVVVARTEAVVETDLARQVRTIRSAYEVVNGATVSKRFVEWPFRFTYRFEAEHLLERAGFEVEAVYGGYRCEPFQSDSRVLLLLARRPAG